MAIFLPVEIREILEKNFQQVSNFFLLMNKYIDCWTNETKIESKQIGEYLSKISTGKYNTVLYSDFFRRWELLLRTIKAVEVRGRVEWRLAIGLGSGSILETSMCLHHILGVPYIPGTAVKGVLRSYYLKKNEEKFLQEKNELRNKDQYNNNILQEFTQEKDETLIKIFGNQEQKGKVIFLDVYPTTFPKIKVDVMNPHYPDYYSGKTPPADWQLPIPLKFLTVERNTEFIFPFKTEENILEDEVKILIKEALSEVGIGAKTSVGYGYFKDLQYVPVQEDQLGGVDSKIAQSPLQTTKLPGYLKNPNELNDDFLNPDGSFKTEEQYKNFLVSKKAKFSKKRKQQYEKAKNWYEKQQDKK